MLAPIFFQHAGDGKCVYYVRVERRVDMIFSNGSVPVAVAAEVYGKDPNWVRTGLIFGWLPIGTATRNGKKATEQNSKLGRINYYISPKLLYEHTGYIWRGENGN